MTDRNHYKRAEFTLYFTAFFSKYVRINSNYYSIFVGFTMATVKGCCDYDFKHPPPEELLCDASESSCREVQTRKGHVYCNLSISAASVSYCVLSVIMYLSFVLKHYPLGLWVGF